MSGFGRNILYNDDLLDTAVPGVNQGEVFNVIGMEDLTREQKLSLAKMEFENILGIVITEVGGPVLGAIVKGLGSVAVNGISKFMEFVGLAAEDGGEYSLLAQEAFEGRFGQENAKKVYDTLRNYANKLTQGGTTGSQIDDNLQRAFDAYVDDMRSKGIEVQRETIFSVAGLVDKFIAGDLKGLAIELINAIRGSGASEEVQQQEEEKVLETFLGADSEQFDFSPYHSDPWAFNIQQSNEPGVDNPLAHFEAFPNGWITADHIHPDNGTRVYSDRSGLDVGQRVANRFSSNTAVTKTPEDSQETQQPQQETQQTQAEKAVESIAGSIIKT